MQLTATAPVRPVEDTTGESATVQKPNLTELKGMLAGMGYVPNHGPESYAFSLHPEGIPRGAITEISGADGSGKTEVVLRFLAEHPGMRVAWIETELTAYPCTFMQMNVDLVRVLFVEAGEQAVWAAMQTLRSGLFGAVILSSHASCNEMDLRRLQLASEKSELATLLLCPTPTTHNHWPIQMQLHVSRPHYFSSCPHIKTLKCKNPPKSAQQRSVAP